MYIRHPNRALNALFRERPFQGVEPTEATYLFVGLDPNYAPDIETHAIFPLLLDYHRDAVSFWRRVGVHHPFLLERYGGDGRHFHRNFARIGFRPDHAERVSFIELMHIPTVGRNRLDVDDLDHAHLARIEHAMLRGRARHIFMSSTTARLLRASGMFPWLGHMSSEPVALPMLYEDEHRCVRQHLHFSVYGKFHARLLSEIAAIAALVSRDDAMRARLIKPA